jgi:hypothetical protein
MVKFARFIGVSAVVIGIPATATPVAGSSNGGEAVEVALAQHNLSAAGVALDNLVEARLPPKDTGRPDPVLDRTFADMLSAQGQLTPAGAILRRIVRNPATPDLDHYRLLLATYEEETGSWAEAQQQYHQIITDTKSSPEAALLATLGIARLQMATDPAAALATLSPLRTKAVPPSMAWELDLLIARAANMAGPGETSTARAALDRAWEEAPNGFVADSAVARVAGDRALIAGRLGDRKTLIAMLAVDRSSRGANGGQKFVVSDLPICGTYGITPQDVVTVSVAHQAPAGRPPITLAWANRPGIAAPFLLAAGRSGSPIVFDGQSATFNLRCRTTPSTDFVVHNSIEEEIAGWMTGLGAYPGANASSSDDVSSLATKLAQRQARYGADSVMLLPLLFRTVLPGVINYGDKDGMKRASANADHILTILENNKAPGALILLWRMTSIGMAVMAQTKTAVQGQAETQALLGKTADDPALSLDTLYMVSVGAA